MNFKMQIVYAPHFHTLASAIHTVVAEKLAKGAEIVSVITNAPAYPAEHIAAIYYKEKA
jgi:hypothetical protein